MLEISFKTLDDHLKDLQVPDASAPSSDPIEPPAIYLVYGEELLVEMAFNKLLDTLLPSHKRHLNYEPLEGTDENIREAIEKMNTYSLLGGRKVVALHDARLFDSKKDVVKMWRDARQAFQAGNIQRAARLFLRLLAISELKLEDLTGPDWQDKLPVESKNDEDVQWQVDILSYCRSSNFSVRATVGDEGAALQQAIGKGFPPGNHLIITAHTIDKKRALYRAIRKTGGLIDCTVAKSQRSVDRKNRQAVLRELAENRLARHHKTIERSAFEALCEKTGFELRGFINNLEKLITYTGPRRRISTEDVERVLQRTKKDPVFTFTNAVTDKNTADALFFMHSLLSEGMRPEQILVAILNQIRKLLLIKEFVTAPAGKTWFPDCPYGTFRSAVVPAISRYDTQLLNQLQDWQDALERKISAEETSGADRSMKKRRATTELTIVKNPNNVFPVYQLFKKSEKFSLEALIQAFEALTAADMRIKSGSQDKSTVLEALVINICA